MAKKTQEPPQAEAPAASEPAPQADPAAPSDMAERVGQRVGKLTSRTLRGMFRVIGRVREEAEDVWAEAQALRQREKTAPPKES